MGTVLLFSLFRKQRLADCAKAGAAVRGVLPVASLHGDIEVPDSDAGFFGSRAMA